MAKKRRPTMRKPVQADLGIREPVEGSFLAELRKRLGHRSFVSVSLVATACDVSVSTVKTWIESGSVEALDVSVTARPYYRVYAPSVLRFYEKRLAHT